MMLIRMVLYDKDNIYHLDKQTHRFANPPSNDKPNICTGNCKLPGNKSVKGEKNSEMCMKF